MTTDRKPLHILWKIRRQEFGGLKQKEPIRKWESLNYLDWINTQYIHVMNDYFEPWKIHIIITAKIYEGKYFKIALLIYNLLKN